MPHPPTINLWTNHVNALFPLPLVVFNVHIWKIKKISLLFEFPHEISLHLWQWGNNLLIKMTMKFQILYLFVLVITIASKDLEVLFEGGGCLGHQEILKSFDDRKIGTAYFWPAVKKRLPRVWLGYFLTLPDEIFFDLKGKNRKILDIYGKFSKPKPKMVDLTRPGSKIFDFQ